MGVFNVTMSWFNAVTFLPGVLAQVLLPLLSSQTAEAGGRSRKKLVFLAVKANALAVIPVALFLICLSPFIMSLYGAGFREGWPTLVLNLLTAAVIAIQGPAAQAVVAAGRMWSLFAMYLGWGVAFLGGTLLLVPSGSFGLTEARLAAYVLSSIAVFLFAMRYCWRASLSSTGTATPECQ
jgi:O-antigen/teichoic acid export membrane protein